MVTKLKKQAFILIAILLIFTLLPISAFADGGDIKDNDNKGGGTGNYQSGHEFTWTDTKSGYRLLGL
ncbi:MAG: hypothetical protein PWQ93_22 [Clostridiales bacterium]|nr:hypothetical protein [Clostridiales bacterium]